VLDEIDERTRTLVLMVYPWIEWGVKPEWCPYFAVGSCELEGVAPVILADLI
jgi:hypothetical protein